MSKKVIIGLSGGVDSAVAAARLLEQGYDVHAFFMKLEESDCDGEDNPTAQALADARKVAAYLGIPPEKFHVWELVDRFERGVITPFVEAYASGLTPNPCVRCNRVFKFGYVVERALREGFDYVATGHYACLDHIGDGFRLRRGASLEKDQSYVLAGARAEMLAHAIFPLFDVRDKAETRAEAQRRGLPVARKRDSFDICFIHDGDTRGFLRGKLGGAQPGAIVDENGAVVGQHLGAFLYTVGQRRGLHLPRPHEDGQPRYVTGVDVNRNVVTVGPLETLDVHQIRCGRINWLVEPGFGRQLLTVSGQESREAPHETKETETPLTVQFRAHSHPEPATFKIDDQDRLTVIFPETATIRGVAPGQSLVIYHGNWVIAQAGITGTQSANPRQDTTES
ncbi:tRNA-specific 2-thiouridylase [Mobiluncus mulieris]|uniref:tRNA-specific 2-thiouridylase MnmA n=1 Tax=Mobiluncus mulieris TaxID=2052 RepID=A0A848RN00_9ACTO|nr:tRNA 2-thiouridine(34) synthase MnmA [Mobiluncus mulieris]MBB5846793.1 tRNA-specific 2-thiouridylase [Mobiluncus mulieris]MCU9972094.1 tRNA 2-thiouridine(34) synthase MnmA [Mobiluncus mulieris]NMW91874.1 tRNA 2-thiouridine(34) synthase MnmA [Mobiluncus mulieris]NMW94132.1 tRNA 2-thiouridine(34) synthase MnmA [Mobiluncus mulieris]PNL42395.1 tRNA 2-thiouridine(34) synthase MnmA [Mobiluncus mulieris]